MVFEDLDPSDILKHDLSLCGCFPARVAEQVFEGIAIAYQGLGHVQVDNARIDGTREHSSRRLLAWETPSSSRLCGVRRALLWLCCGRSGYASFLMCHGVWLDILTESQRERVLTLLPEPGRV
jgi:hypothetical protein